MDLPTSTLGIAVVVALVVPGIVYAGTRTALTGYRGTDKTLGTKLADAVTVSVVLDAAYLVLAGRSLVAGLRFLSPGDEVLVSDPLPVGLDILAFAVVGPVLLALLRHAVPWRQVPLPAWVGDLRRRFGPVVIDRTPTAWDFAARSDGGRFVRVRRSGGTIVGGWFGNNSYLSGYPESRDLFVEEEYEFDAEGAFLRPLNRTAGLWLSIQDDDIIEWSK